MTYKTLSALNQAVIGCTLCKRLVAYRESVLPKPQFAHQSYWKKPVPGFGDPKAHLFILGLAPSAQGGNRTGRIFTGDGSGDFLFKALYKAGLANQSTSIALTDGLKLMGCYITAAVKCAPPKNKPTPVECKTCSQYWTRELTLLKEVTSILVLGKFAFDTFCTYAKAQGCQTKGLVFKHGGIYPFEGLPTLYASYHPSPQNTNTGKLTEEMLLDVLKEAFPSCKPILVQMLSR